MFIVVNGYPIDVYKIERISRIYTINKESYSSVLSAYGSFIKKQLGSISYKELYENLTSTKKENYRFYHTFLEKLDEVHRAVVGDGITVVNERTNLASVVATYLQNPPMEKTTPRLMRPEEIYWNIIPDIYFFGIQFNEGENRFLSGELTTPDQLFSRFYDTEKDAEEARDLLLEAINSVRNKAPKIDI